MNFYFDRIVRASCSASERGAYFSPAITIFEMAHKDIVCLSPEEMYSVHDDIQEEDTTDIW